MKSSHEVSLAAEPLGGPRVFEIALPVAGEAVPADALARFDVSATFRGQSSFLVRLFSSFGFCPAQVDFQISVVGLSKVVVS